MPPSSCTRTADDRAADRRATHRVPRRDLRRGAISMRTILLLGFVVHLTVHAPGAGAQTGARAPLPPLSVRAPLYEVYASDSSSLLATRADIEFAVAQFRRYFGEDPAPLAVVVLDAATGTVGVDDRTVSARGFQVLPWMSDGALQRVRQEHDAAMGSVTSLHAGANVGRAVSHEACHVYLRAHVDRRQGHDGERTALRGAYGHEDVPDWFDEAVATLCEPEHKQEQRTAELRAGIGQAIPLEEFLAMRHPGLPQGTTPTAGAGPSGGATPGDTAPGAVAPGGTPRIYRRDGMPISAEDEERIRRAIAGDLSTGLKVERSSND